MRCEFNPVFPLRSLCGIVYSVSCHPHVSLLRWVNPCCYFVFTLPYKREFLKRNRTALVSHVKNVKAIVDDLQSGDCHDEMAAIMNAQLTPQEMMRKLLDSATSTGAANAMIQALLTQKDVMDDLIAENA
uniref:CARD domain-containing protein n=1 Tax=Oncorhynchus kisutch TaxID=8019 RepID=A0A8C7HG65_ONCKI